MNLQKAKSTLRRKAKTLNQAHAIEKAAYRSAIIKLPHDQYEHVSEAVDTLVGAVKGLGEESAIELLAAIGACMNESKAANG